jgi:hypothetical protein
MEADYFFDIPCAMAQGNFTEAMDVERSAMTR